MSPVAGERSAAWAIEKSLLGVMGTRLTNLATAGFVVTTSTRVAAGGGLAHENEDIEVLELPLDEAFQLLERGKIADPAKQKQYFGLLVQEARRLAMLIENILDFSRIERGRKQYEFKMEDITKLIRDTVERFKAIVAHEDFPLSLNMDPDIPLLRIDAEAISQALTNLLANAVNYSPAEKDIKVQVLKKPHAVVLEVADRGLGIARKEQKKIFEKFYRVDKERSRNLGGTGLGLSIVKQIAKIHSGSISLKSALGKGSTFTLIFPV